MRHIFVTVLCVGLVPCCLTSAAPITGDIVISSTKVGSYVLVDEMSSTTLSITGFPVSVTGFTELIIGTNWRYELVINLRGTLAPDFVTISGNVLHINPPADAPAHQAATSFPVSLIFTAQGPPIITPPTATESHPPHEDRYSQTITGIQLGNDILGWSASIEGRHVPEPMTSLLCLVPLAAVFWHRRHA